MTTDEKSKEPVGYAVYLEFRKNEGSPATYQMIITPAGLTSSGEETNCVVFRRLVSETSPRGQWRTVRLPNTFQPSAGVTNPQDLFTLLAGSWDKSGINYGLTTLYMTSKWSLYKQPIAVEASKEDLDDAIRSATPTALIKRIRKVREALGFPEGFYEVSTPTPTTTV